MLIMAGLVIASIASLVFLTQGKRHVRVFNKSSMRLLRRGLNCFMNNDLQGAIDNLNKSIALDANNGRCHEYLSFAYAQSGHYYLAKKHAGIALRFNSEYFAHIANSMFYRYKLELKKSLEEARKAIAFDDNNYHGHFWAGMAAADLGKFGEAFSECNKVRRCDTYAGTILSKYIRDLEARVSGRAKDVAAIEYFPAGSRSVERNPMEVDFTAPRSEESDSNNKKHDYYGPREKNYHTADNSFKGFDDLFRDQANGGVNQLDPALDGTDNSQYLSLLDLSPGASRSDIKDAYRNLVKVWHPDRFAHDPQLQQFAEQKLGKINEAYRHLTGSL